MSSEFELISPPTDGISSLLYSKTNPSLLCVNSWDSSSRIYDTNTNNNLHIIEHSAPVLDSVFNEDSSILYTGCIDNTLYSYDLYTNQFNEIHIQDGGIKCLAYHEQHKQLYTGNWSGTINSFDSRLINNNSNNNIPVQTVNTENHKIYTMALAGNKIIVGTSNRFVYVYDIRNLSKWEQKRVSSLPTQTRCIRAFPNQLGYALSSIDGRIAIEYLSPDTQSQSQKYVFKCHRVNDKDSTTIYSINNLSFHPSIEGSFASGGSDGNVCIWNYNTRKRIAQYKNYGESISALCFNSDGTQLAIASGDTFEQGEEKQNKQKDRIIIHNVNSREVTPQSNTNGAKH